jgi:DNA mismatch endonuclease, patch repair protein
MNRLILPGKIRRRPHRSRPDAGLGINAGVPTVSTSGVGREISCAAFDLDFLGSARGLAVLELQRCLMSSPSSFRLRKVSASRSYNMARVRGDMDTLVEKKLASYLWRQGIRGYRRRCKVHLGKPDFCFHREKIAVFLDGCFWHCCPLHFKLPVSNVQFWSKKLADNRARDMRQTRQLRRRGWAVLRFWNHALNSESGTLGAVRRVATVVNGRTRKLHSDTDLTFPRGS